jgi:hypothetical protein
MLPPGANFTNILWEAFAKNPFAKNLQTQIVSTLKLRKNLFKKKLLVKYWWNCHLVNPNYFYHSPYWETESLLGLLILRLKPTLLKLVEMNNETFRYFKNFILPTFWLKSLFRKLFTIIVMLRVPIQRVYYIICVYFWRLISPSFITDTASYSSRRLLDLYGFCPTPRW